MRIARPRPAVPLAPVLPAALCLLAAIPAQAQQGPAGDVLARLAPAVVRVIARDCGGAEDRSGSGFVWQAPQQVVTDFHVVSGCSRLIVSYQGLREVEARAERVYLPADLVELRVQPPPGFTLPATVLSSIGQVPRPGETVRVYGYALGVPTRDDKPLTVTQANLDAPLLNDSVDAKAREELRRLGAPSLQTEVLRLDGNLLPGHSGAPILDHDGQLVGIGSGGLQNGTVGTGWAVRAHYLTELLRAPPGVLPAPSGSSGPLFAQPALPPDGQVSQIRCGELSLVRTRRLSLEALVASSDDPVGLYQIAATTQRPLDSFRDLQFDIWTERNSGAGIAVPTGARLDSRADGCAAIWHDGAVEMRIAGARLPDALPSDMGWQAQVQRTSSAFELAWAREFLPALQQNPAFSYIMPQERRGGMVVNRKFFAGMRPDHPYPYGIFETLMARRTAFIGVAAIDRRYIAAPPLPEEIFRTWIAAGFATHLSTFPP